MRVVLEVHSGPIAGKKIWLRPGQALEVGRTERSEFVVPLDRQMSSRHFSLECDDRSCRVRDLDSTNGTLLNGEKVTEAFVCDGDQIVAGQTTFVVRVEGLPPASGASSPLAKQTADPQAMSAVEAPVQSPQPPGVAALAGSPLTLPRATGPTTLPKSITIPPPFVYGLNDDDPKVRHEALLAAVWTRQEWLLYYCRNMAEVPCPEHWDAIMLLALLGRPSDAELILAIGKTVQLGPKRYQVLGTFGHPAVIDTLLKRIESQDPLNAPAAGLAFTKITGADIASEKNVLLPEEGDSEPTEETELVEVVLPSAQRAWDHWKKVRDQFAKGTRWRRGFDLSCGARDEVLAQLDLQSRWEVCLRGKFEGTWHGTPMDLEVFPQRGR